MGMGVLIDSEIHVRTFTPSLVPTRISADPALPVGEQKVIGALDSGDLYHTHARRERAWVVPPMMAGFDRAERRTRLQLEHESAQCDFFDIKQPVAHDPP
jgi:hypothetical protein